VLTGWDLPSLSLAHLALVHNPPSVDSLPRVTASRSRQDPGWEYKKRAWEGCGQLCVCQRRVSKNLITLIRLWDIGAGYRGRRFGSQERVENASDGL
jgi:hypothetical protein